MIQAIHRAGLPYLLSVTALTAYVNVSGAHEPETYYRADTNKLFADVVDDAVFAITERNFRLSAHLHIGKAIRDRGNSGFPDYEVLLYCNLAHTKIMLELDADVINSCPGRIIIRQAADKVVITANLWPRRPENSKLESYTQKINSLVREIVDYAADDWQSGIGFKVD